jgi:hypothetical protein
VYYFMYLAQHQLLQANTLLIGFIFGMAINYFGILKLITVLSDKNSPYIFKPFH